MATEGDVWGTVVRRNAVADSVAALCVLKLHCGALWVRLRARSRTDTIAVSDGGWTEEVKTISAAELDIQRGSLHEELWRGRRGGGMRYVEPTVTDLPAVEELAIFR